MPVAGVLALRGSGVCPHLARTRAGQPVIEADCDKVEVVLEEIGVDVERHRCRTVAEHPLRGLHVRARLDREARGGVPEVVIRAISRVSGSLRQGGRNVVRFDHRGPDVDENLVDRVWRTHSDCGEVMTSAARTSFQLIVARSAGRIDVGLRGPETRASTALVPEATEYLGVRFALGAVLRAHPASTMVDGYVPLPVVDGRAFVLGGELWEVPTFETVELFIERLRCAGLLLPSTLNRDASANAAMPTRTRQRRIRELTGMPLALVTQIDRANAAATRLRGGDSWAAVVDSFGFFDQPHLARALRRFVGLTASELQRPDTVRMSFLYKTGSNAGS